MRCSKCLRRRHTVYAARAIEAAKGARAAAERPGVRTARSGWPALMSLAIRIQIDRSVAPALPVVQSEEVAFLWQVTARHVSSIEAWRAGVGSLDSHLETIGEAQITNIILRNSYRCFVSA